MQSELLSPTYTLDAERHLWTRSDYAGIGYSDGDDVEARIAGIISNATDLTVLSSELAAHCKDWPSLYHLSRRRANLLRPLESYLRNASVLEVGAGCGAITRYLGETSAKVLALEGSLYRASIAASRCRDLENVAIVAEAFHLFKPAYRFDVVTLIGVLEYARKFFPSLYEDPVDAMLAHARQFLKPGGKLIIAIENQLGLKYFAGFPEDHVSKPMFGIEGHYSGDSAVTFGRGELSKRVSKAGLNEQRWWYPFPDYKLPTLLVSETGAGLEESIHLIPTVCSACGSDAQYPKSISFMQERAWRPVIHNGLLRDVANSFLLEASDIGFPQHQDLPLAIHFATDRRPEFAKKVVFKRTHGTIVTHQIALYPFTKVSKGSVLRHQLADQPFIKGELWQDRLLQIMTSAGWTIEQIQEWIKVWFNAFCIFADIKDLDNVADRRVPGKYLDAIPRNMVLDKNGAMTFIDQEWIFFENLNVGYLAFRALLTSLSPLRVVAKPFEDKYLRVLQLLISVMQHINVDVNECMIKEYFDLEAKLDQLAGGKQTYNKEELALGFMSLELNVFDTRTPVHEKLAQQDAQLTYVSQALVQRDKQLNDILNSASWRLTRPLRTLKKWFKSQ
ncbi:class I SAM-dependent methyltransferase [Nitrosospira multiformis]|uniref:class I SAM-dependent methyltransferase n=1 Tax=Nitrosospira multiformis TaxID=1231 RepID=UPI00089D04A3|nr:class I SAM-dependent methyltransferase [Nitrosospira multiformis]SEA43541.1 Methyltransferase domain-containing protein [Nitrosospira multiformis]